MNSYENNKWYCTLTGRTASRRLIWKSKISIRKYIKKCFLSLFYTCMYIFLSLVSFFFLSLFYHLASSRLSTLPTPSPPPSLKPPSPIRDLATPKNKCFNKLKKTFECILSSQHYFLYITFELYFRYICVFYFFLFYTLWISIGNKVNVYRRILFFLQILFYFSSETYFFYGIYLFYKTEIKLRFVCFFKQRTAIR